MSERVDRRLGFADVLLFLLGLCAAPFVLAGIVNVIPESSSFWVAIAIALGIAAVLWVWVRRSLGLGLAMGVVAVFVFVWAIAESIKEAIENIQFE